MHAVVPRKVVSETLSVVNMARGSLSITALEAWRRGCKEEEEEEEEGRGDGLVMGGMGRRAVVAETVLLERSSPRSRGRRRGSSGGKEGKCFISIHKKKEWKRKRSRSRECYPSRGNTAFFIMRRERN